MRKYYRTIIEMKSPLQLLCLLILSFTAYFPVLVAPQTVSPDAYFILPLFDRMLNISDYIEYLFQLKTIDIQPVRDLSLFIDWKVYKMTGFNTFIIQNVLLWVLCCFFAVKVLEEMVLKAGSKSPYVFGLCYCVYPLFSGTVSWSIARKHILALLFTILATYHLIKFLKTQGSRHLALMNIWYFLGIFSQPIGILWPFWALLYVLILKKECWPRFKKGIFAAMVIFILGFTVQYIYYSKSSLFASIFSSKTAEILNFELKFMALGHYFYQIFAPYSLAFPYSLRFNAILFGYIFVSGFCLIFWKLKLPLKELGLWLLFAILPLSIILNTPRLLLDPYLLLPSFAFLVLAYKVYSTCPNRWSQLASIPLILIWTGLTHHNAKSWSDPLLFAQRNFHRAPNCINAIRLARTFYDQEQKMPQEAHDFLASNQCLSAETTYANLELRVFLGQYIYFENNHPFERKIKFLDELGKDFFYPKLVLAAILLNKGKEASALKILQEVIQKNGNLTLDTAADPIIPKVIHPFCLKINYADCLKLTRQVKFKREAPYF